LCPSRFAGQKNGIKNRRNHRFTKT